MVILGLGSNLGDRLEFLRKSIGYISKILSDITTSGIYESDALLPPDAPKSWDIPFLNMAVGGKTDISPHDLLTKIKAIETKMGRNQNSERWSPREIDIDIITYDNLVMKEKSLTVPHKHLSERLFFLLPLRDIEPKWKYPKKGKNYGKTAVELAKDISSDSVNTKKTVFSIA